MPELKEVRDTVKRDLLAERQQELKDAAYANSGAVQVVVEKTSAAMDRRDGHWRWVTLKRRLPPALLVMLLLSALFAPAAAAHESQPGTLDLRQVGRTGTRCFGGRRFTMACRTRPAWNDPVCKTVAWADRAATRRLTGLPEGRDGRRTRAGREHYRFPGLEGTSPTSLCG